MGRTQFLLGACDENDDLYVGLLPMLTLGREPGLHGLQVLIELAQVSQLAGAAVEDEQEVRHTVSVSSATVGCEAIVNHSGWKTARERAQLAEYREDPETEAMRAEIRLAFDLGQAVYDRRSALGISQSELARRVNMTQPQISNLELGGTVPTLPLLARLAKALHAA
jgi:ribosome-binding protein aMBF1 (putative translation factor)